MKTVDIVDAFSQTMALMLINRQKAEIDRLNELVSLSIDTQNDFSDTITKQKVEIERLKEENERYKECNRIIAYQRDKLDEEIEELHSELRGLNFMRNQIKSEAIKEFEKEVEKALECNYEVRRKRMKSVHCGNDEFLSYLNGKIDCLRALQEFAKEMVGERE